MKLYLAGRLQTFALGQKTLAKLSACFASKLDCCIMLHAKLVFEIIQNLPMTLVKVSQKQFYTCVL